MVEARRIPMEEQLAQYRNRKRKEQELTALKQKLSGYVAGVLTFWWSLVTPTPGPAGEGPDSEASSPAGLNGESRRRKGSVGEDTTTTTPEEEEPPAIPYTTLDWAMLLLKVLVWLLLQKVFILMEFGAVFFIFSAFLFMWYNLRSEPKRKGEASAYSVFNPNCEAIDGTFTAEQFERELLYKM